MSYVEALTVSATVCWKGLLAFVLLRKSALVLSLRSFGRSGLDTGRGELGARAEAR